MKVRSVLVAMVAAYCVGAESASGQEAGWYAGLDAGVSDVGVSADFWLDGDRSSGEVDTVGPMFQLSVGYRWNRYLAAEVTYLRVGETVFRGETDGFNSRWNAGSMEGKTRIEGYHVQAVARWPWGSRFALYAKGGLLFWDTTTLYDSTINDVNRFNDDGVNPIVGAGMDIRLWRDWRLRAEYQYSIVNLEQRNSVDVHLATLGVMHPFP